MANVQHASIGDADRHEAKGASTAASGTYCRGNGDGTTTFANIHYSEVLDTPPPSLPSTGGALTGPVQPGLYTLATLPSASTYKYALIVVTDATAGPALALSNGTNWIDVRTNATVA